MQFRYCPQDCEKPVGKNLGCFLTSQQHELFPSHPWADAELENLMELDTPGLDFPGIVAQATGFISFSLQGLRAPLEAPEPLMTEPGTFGGSCCVVHPVSWGVLDILHVLGLC